MGYQQKSYKKFVATAATATLVASAIVPVASAAGFSDVSENSEFAPFINALVEEGIINGYASDNTFRPNNKLTRGQVAIMLGRWLENNGETVPADWNTVSRFEDVPVNATSAAGEELAKYAALVKDSGVFTGVLGNLNPGQNITRENMAVVLDRVSSTVAGISLVELAEEIEDVQVSDLATAQTAYQDEIQALADLGITTVSNFRPKEQVSRAQFAKFLYTTLEIIEEVTAPLSAAELKAEVASIVGTLPEVNTITTVETAQAAKTTATEAGTALAAIEAVIADGEYTEAEVTELTKVVADAKTAVAAVVTKADEVIEAAKDLKVESVSAINASELQVKFNQAVDEKTATDASNYQLKINNADVAASEIIDINLSEDKKTATILLDQSARAFQNGDKYVIQTKDAILSANGKKAEKFVSNEITFTETAAPSLVSVAKSGDILTLTFDRPVNASAAANKDVTLVKVDGIEIGSTDLKPVSPKAGNNEVLGEAGKYVYTITLTDATAIAEAKKVGTHEVVIFDVADTAAAYKKVASVLTGSYTVTDQVTAPEVTGVEAVNANRFFLYTNTTVDLTGAALTVNKGTHEFAADTTKYNGTVDAGTSVTVTDAAVGTYKGKPGVWVVVTDNNGATEENPLYRSGEAAVNLSVVLEKYTADGLIGKKSTQSVTLTKNNTKPVVESTNVGADEKSLVVTFTNDLVDLTGGALTLAEGTDFVVRDKDGIIIEGFAAVVSGKNVTLTKTVSGAQVELKDAPYTVEFKEGKFKNKEDRTSVTSYLANTLKNDVITAKVGKEAESNFKYTEFAFDTNPSTGNAAVDTVNNTITFKYNQKMSDSARNVANYTLDGKALPAGTTADFVGDRQTVRVVFPAGTFKTSTQYKFGVTTNVTTEAGSIIVGSLQTKAPAELVFGVTDNVKPELASAVYYVGTETVTNQTKTNKIEVTFNEAVEIAAANTAKKAANDFVVVINGSKYAVTAVDAVTTGDNANRKLVLTLEDSINVSQAATISVVPEADQAVASGETAATVKEIAVTDLAGNKAKEGSSVALAANAVKYNAALASAVSGELTTAKSAIEGATYTLTAADHNTADAAKTYVTSVVNGLPEVSGKGFTVTVAQTGFTAATAGTTDGEYKFTVTLSKFGQTETTSEITAVISQ